MAGTERDESRKTLAHTPLHVQGALLPTGAKRDVFVVEGRLTFDDPGDALTVAENAYVMPGLVDMHCHLSAPNPDGPPADPVEDAVHSGREELRSGVLAVREPGNPWRSARRLGPRDGCPRVFTAGRWIAAPSRFVPGCATFADADELVEAALAELRDADGWVKIIGDWVGRDGTLSPSFSSEQLAGVVTAVAAHGGRVAVHASDERTVEAAVDAGVASIEHAVGMTAQLSERMAQRGIAMVPTLLATRDVKSRLQRRGAHPKTVDRVVRACEAHPSAVADAVEAGVRMFVGTDAGLIPHGMIVGEMEALAAAGCDVEEVLGAASWAARSFLGLRGIEEGAHADLLVLSKDPREDLQVLRTPIAVILDGRVVGPATEN